MQTHKSQQFRIVLQNPLVTLLMLMFLLRAAHSWFNQVKSLLGVKKSLLTFTLFTPDVICPLCPLLLYSNEYPFRHLRPSACPCPIQTVACALQTLDQVFDVFFGNIYNRLTKYISQFSPFSRNHVNRRLKSLICCCG